MFHSLFISALNLNLMLGGVLSSAAHPFLEPLTIDYPPLPRPGLQQEVVQSCGFSRTVTTPAPESNFFFFFCTLCMYVTHRLSCRIAASSREACCETLTAVCESGNEKQNKRQRWKKYSDLLLK